MTIRRRLAYDVAVSGSSVPEVTIPAVLNTPISLTYDGSHVWVVDRLTALAQKMSRTLRYPGVIASVDMSSYLSGSRQIRYDPGSGLLFVSGHTSGNVVIIRPSTNTIVGTFSVGPSGSGRARAVNFDGAGNFWVINSFAPPGNVTRIFKVSIADALSSFPSSPAPLLTVNVAMNALEDLAFGAGYLWTTAGNWERPGELYRIDPATGTLVHGYVGGNDFDYQWSPYYAFGSVWTNTETGDLFRWDPAQIPSGWTAAYTDPAGTAALKITGLPNGTMGEMVSDGTYLWSATGYASSGAGVSRFNVGHGTESIEASVIFDGGGMCDGVAWDGTRLWATHRYGSTGGYLQLISATPGAEAPGPKVVNGATGGNIAINANYVQPGGTTNYPYDVVYHPGTDSLWVADFQNAAVYKVNATSESQVDTVDTSPVNSVRMARTDGTYIYLVSTSHNTNFSTDGGYVTIIDPTTDRIVGAIDRTAYGRVRDIAIDGNNIYLNVNPGIHMGASPCVIEQYSLSAILFQWSDVQTPVLHPIIAYDNTTHYEFITFAAGYIWATDGSAHTNTLYRIDPSTGTQTSQTAGPSGGAQNAWAITYAFGSIWIMTGGGVGNYLCRFDPATWPSAPIAEVALGSLVGGCNEITSDWVHLWMGSAAGGSGSPFLTRVDPTLGSERVLSYNDFTTIENNPYFRATASSAPGVCWVQETNFANRSLIRVTGAPGSEVIDKRINFFGVALVTVSVDDSSVKRVGDTVTVAGGGTYIVHAIPDSTHWVLQNTFAPYNAAPGTTIQAPAFFT